MTTIAAWLLLLTVGLPTVGVLVAVILTSLAKPREGSAIFSVRLGIFASISAAFVLLLLLIGVIEAPVPEAVWPIGTALELSGPKPIRIAWGLRADLISVSWIMIVSILAFGTLSSVRTGLQGCCGGSLAITAGTLHVSVVALAMSTSFPQLLFFWGAVLLATWTMVGWSTPTDDSTHSFRHAAITSLVSDGPLVLAVLLMSVTCRTMLLDEVLSVEGMTALRRDNPFLPGSIGTLLVLSLWGRSGLFPCFLWNQSSTAWDPPIWRMVYFVAYVPSSLWLLLRFYPVIASSEASLALLGGLGMLGAVVGAFVACGQIEPRGIASFLVTSQVGVVFAAVSWWLSNAGFQQGHSDGIVEAVPPLMDGMRVVIGQSAVFFAALFIWRSTSFTDVHSKNSGCSTRSSWSAPLVILSREKLYVEKIVFQLITVPTRFFLDMARSVDRSLKESCFAAIAIRLPAWIGQQIESLQIDILEFELATALLSGLIVLLTWMLVT